MKAEERHELKQNDLASWLQYGLPMFLKQNGSYLILGAALCFLAYQLFHLYQTKQDNARRAAWAELASAPLDPNPAARWQGIIDTYDYPELKVQAYFDMATFYSRITLFPEQLTILKLTRNESLTKAYDAYKHAHDLMPNDPLIAAKALLGLAGVDEDKGEWDAAKKEYESIVSNTLFAKTSFVDFANDRLATLNERRDAPRLAAMIPATTLPAIPVLPGALGTQLPPELEFKNLGTTPAGGTAPAGPLLPGGSMGPIIPIEPAMPATAPATQPK